MGFVRFLRVWIQMRVVGESGFEFWEGGSNLLGDGCEILINNQPRVWQEIPPLCCVRWWSSKRKSMPGGGFLMMLTFKDWQCVNAS